MALFSLEYDMHSLLPNPLYKRQLSMGASLFYHVILPNYKRSDLKQGLFLVEPQEISQGTRLDAGRSKPKNTIGIDRVWG
mgnify:CR=1 FL=1